MLGSYQDDETLPYRFARIQGIFHVKILFTGSSPPLEKRLDVLWVRWYRVANLGEFGWENRRLPRVEFFEDEPEGPHPYGFIDPNCVIRAVHMEPAFDWASERKLGQDINPFQGVVGAVDEYDYYYVNW